MPLSKVVFLKGRERSPEAGLGMHHLVKEIQIAKYMQFLSFPATCPHSKKENIVHSTDRIGGLSSPLDI